MCHTDNFKYLFVERTLKVENFPTEASSELIVILFFVERKILYEIFENYFVERKFFLVISIDMNCFINFNDVECMWNVKCKM